MDVMEYFSIVNGLNTNKFLVQFVSDNYSQSGRKKRGNCSGPRGPVWPSASHGLYIRSA